MVQLMGHRQTKGPVTVRQHLNYRATSRLHSYTLQCSKQENTIQEEREASHPFWRGVSVLHRNLHTNQQWQSRALKRHRRQKGAVPNAMKLSRIVLLE